MAANPKKAKQTVEPLPGTKVEDEAARMKSSQMIVEKLLAMTKSGDWQGKKYKFDFSVRGECCSCLLGKRVKSKKR